MTWQFRLPDRVAGCLTRLRRPGRGRSGPGLPQGHSAVGRGRRGDPAACAGREAELLARIALLEAQLHGQAEQPMHG